MMYHLANYGVPDRQEGTKIFSLFVVSEYQVLYLLYKRGTLSMAKLTHKPQRAFFPGLPRDL